MFAHLRTSCLLGILVCMAARSAPAQEVGGPAAKLTPDEIEDLIRLLTTPRGPDGREILPPELFAKAAQINAYRQFLLQAQASLREKDGGENARRLLELCPKELRGFEWHYLHRQAYTEGFLLKGHDKPIHCAVFSPDKKTLATAGADDTIKVWDLTTTKVRHSLKGHDKEVLALAFHPDGKTLASGSDDASIMLWDTATGKLLFAIEGQQGAVAGLAFSPDGTLLASYSNKPTVALFVCPPFCFAVIRREEARIQVFEMPKGKKVFAAIEPDTRLNCLAFSPDGQYLATAGAGRLISLRAVPGFEVAGTLRGHGEEVTSMFFDPEGQLISAGADGLRFWDVPSREPIRALTGPEHRPVQTLAASGPGTTIATIGLGGKVRVGYAPFDKMTERFDAPPHGRSILALHPHGHLLAMEAPDFAIRIVDLGEQTALLETGEPVWSIQATTKRLLVAMRSNASEVELKSNGEQQEHGLTGHKGAVRAIVAQPRGNLVATAGVEGIVRIWNSASKELVHRLEGHAGQIRSLAFNDDNKHLASAGSDGIKIWDAVAGREIHTLRGHTFMVTSVVFLPKSRLLLSAGADGTIRLWDTALGTELQKWKAHGDIISHLAISPDGTRLASAGYDDKVKLWALDPKKAPRRPSHTLSASTGFSQGLSFSPDGKRLATGGGMASALTLWDPETGQEIFGFPRSAGPVNAVSFSPDGRSLFSGSYDGTVMSWRARPLD